MKHYPRIEMDVGGNHDFPRLARESGFYFNLYRGRVDWKQIDLLDIDRLIRERDLESLQSVFASIASCNLTNEYDVKVLDPNFVKLFRLAQLAVDYLQYCRNYLDHCVIVLQEQLQVALHEVEQLQVDRQTKEDQIKQLTKKLKERAKLSSSAVTTNVVDYGTSGVNFGLSTGTTSGVNAGLNAGAPQTFRCIPCGKMFVNSIFLERHILRRHPEQVKPDTSTENLRLEIQKLQERLQKAEELLKQSRSQTEETTKEEPVSRDEVEQIAKHSAQEKVDKAQNTDQELMEVKPSESDEIQKRSHQSEEDIRALMENFKRQSEEIESLRNQLKTQHFAQESLWQNRLDQLEQRHHSDIDALRTSLSQPTSLTTPSPMSRTVNLKEHQEKQVQISRPEMAVKETQVDRTPERIFSQPHQEAFINPTPRELFPTPSPKQHSQNASWSKEPVKTKSLKPVINQSSPKERVGMTPATRVRQQTPEEVPSTSSGVSAKMGEDFSSTESSTEESSEQTPIPGISPLRDESETEQDSSTSTDGGIKRLSSLANKPQVFAPLRQDIEGVMFRSLRDLGIDPEWRGIPNATYQSVQSTLQHQRSISQKGRRDLVKLREELSREVDSRSRKVMSSQSPQTKGHNSVRKVPARPPPPRNSLGHKQQSGNEYTAEPRREKTVKPIVVYEEVRNKEETKNVEPQPPLPPSRSRSVEKSPVPQTKDSTPIPPPRVTPSTAELLADMEKLRQQGTLLKSENSTMAKSNLKSASSTGNIAKKRVVFQDEKDDFPIVQLGLKDSEFGMFQARSSTEPSINYSNKAHSYATQSVHRDVTSFDRLPSDGSGEPARSGETNVARLAREIEKQLQNKPKPPQSSYLSGSVDLRSSQLDLILDDLSSS